MKKLQVPENISLRQEFWQGFGTKEMTASVIATVISIFPAVALVQTGVLAVFFGVGLVMLVFAVCVSLLSKLENNQSIVDYLNRQAKYQREQQNFRYVREQEAYFDEKQEREKPQA